jgi:general control protein GCN4
VHAPGQINQEFQQNIHHQDFTLYPEGHSTTTAHQLPQRALSTSNPPPRLAFNSVNQVIYQTGANFQNIPGQKQKSRLLVVPHQSNQVPTMSGSASNPSPLPITISLTRSPVDDFEFDAMSPFNGTSFMDSSMFGEDAVTGADGSNLASFATVPTVSPEQLMNQSFGSAPSSGNFDGTPFTDYGSYHASPAFQTMDGNAGGSLFGFKSDNTLLDFSSVPMQRNLSDTSISSDNGAAAAAAAAAGYGHAKRPSLSKIHTSSSSGITKPRQRRATKLLPDISLDDGDPVARKRQKNTLAARVSRKKKAEKLDSLEATVEALRAELIALGYDGPLLTEYLDPEESEL